MRYLIGLLFLFSLSTFAENRNLTAGVVPDPILLTGDVVTLHGFDNPMFNGKRITMMRDICQCGGPWPASYFDQYVIQSDNTVMTTYGNHWDVAIMSDDVFDKFANPFVDASLFEFIALVSETTIEVRFKSNGFTTITDYNGLRVEDETTRAGTGWTSGVPLSIYHYEIKWEASAWCDVADAGGGYVGDNTWQTLSNFKSIKIDISNSGQCTSPFTIRAKYDHNNKYSDNLLTLYQTIDAAPQVDMSSMPDYVLIDSYLIIWPEDNNYHNVWFDGSAYAYAQPPAGGYAYEIKASLSNGLINAGSNTASYYETDVWDHMGDANEFLLSGTGLLHLSIRDSIIKNNTDSKIISIVNRVDIAGQTPETPLLTGDVVYLSGFNNQSFNGKSIEMLRNICQCGGAWASSYFDAKTSTENGVILNSDGSIWDVGIIKF